VVVPLVSLAANAIAAIASVKTPARATATSLRIFLLRVPQVGVDARLPPGV
jgi:hypothetical protein